MYSPMTKQECTALNHMFFDGILFTPLVDSSTEPMFSVMEVVVKESLA